MKLDFYIVNRYEDEALYGLPSHVKALYLYALKKLMDPRNHRMKGVAWNTITAELEVHPAPGIKAERLSISAAKRALEHLIKRGLVVRESEDRSLKLFFPLAAMGSSVSKKAGRVADLLDDPIADRKNTTQAYDFKGLSGGDDSIAGRVAEPIADPIAGLSKNNLTVPYRTYTSCAKFEGVLTVDGWKAFFVFMGFESVAVVLPVCVAMYEDWVRRGIDVELVEHALDLAFERLGKRPDNPSYYRSIVDELVKERNQYTGQRLVNPSGIALWMVNGETVVAASGEEQAGKYFKKVAGISARHVELMPDDHTISLMIRGEERSVTARDVVDRWIDANKSVPGIVLEM